VKLGELINHLEAATGLKAIREQKPLQPGDVPLTWANIEKSRHLLGYEPQILLDDGLRRFVTWFRASNR
jgi:UDP-glucuronate 4-epimerase